MIVRNSKRTNRSRILTATIMFALIFPFSLVYGYETDWNDPKFKDPEAKEGTLSETLLNSNFKIDGSIFTGYEFLDRGTTGNPEAGGGDKTGFSVTRTYINFRGKVQEGMFKGWGFRITPDIQRADEFTNNCDNAVDDTGATASCSGKNSYVYYMKYAYVDIPILKKTWIRLGQQGTPTSSGAAGVDMTGIWGHRYLTTQGKDPLNQMGLTESADLGVSIIHKADYYGIHLMLSNGEGYHHANAEVLNTGDLTTLSQGADDSYGYDFYGMLSIIPTGKSKDLKWSINLPFREQNFIGMDQSEYTVRNMDISDYNDPKFSLYRSSTRAKKDAVYALDTDVELKLNGVKFTVGGGKVMYKDRRANAYLIDETVLNGINPADITTINDHFVSGEDQKGYGTYGFAHLKVGSFGGVFRYMEGTGGSSLNGKVSAVSTKPFVAKYINADVQDGVLGNIGYYDALALETSKGKFKSVVAGITYHFNDRFRITLGHSRLSGRDTTGKPYRENLFEHITDGSGNTVASQIEDQSTPTGALIASSMGLSPSDTLDLNDLIGKKKVITETFLRAQYSF